MAIEGPHRFLREVSLQSDPILASDEGHGGRYCSSLRRSLGQCGGRGEIALAMGPWPPWPRPWTPGHGWAMARPRRPSHCPGRGRGAMAWLLHFAAQPSRAMWRSWRRCSVWPWPWDEDGHGSGQERMTQAGILLECSILECSLQERIVQEWEGYPLGTLLGGTLLAMAQATVSRTWPGHSPVTIQPWSRPWTRPWLGY